MEKASFTPGQSKTDKNRSRSRAKKILSSRDSRLRKEAPQRACAALKGTQVWRESRSVLCHLSFGDELDTNPIVESVLAEGKNLYVPRVKDRALDFFRLNSLKGPFNIGVFGIREPADTSSGWDPLASPGPTLVLVPGLAFNSKGGRLGRGGGYYDRFISILRLEAQVSGEQAPLFIGYAFESQMMEGFPLSEHDEFVDGIVTESGFRFFG